MGTLFSGQGGAYPSDFSSLTFPIRVRHYYYYACEYCPSPSTATSTMAGCRTLPPTRTGSPASRTGFHATNPKTGVGQRQRNQQGRIAQGVKSGQLTAGETAHLEHHEAAINKEVKTERAANGGKLTPVERRQVNRQQNRTSNAIYRKKHNGRTQ